MCSFRSSDGCGGDLLLENAPLNPHADALSPFDINKHRERVAAIQQKSPGVPDFAFGMRDLSAITIASVDRV